MCQHQQVGLTSCCVTIVLFFLMLCREAHLHFVQRTIVAYFDSFTYKVTGLLFAFLEKVLRSLLYSLICLLNDDTHNQLGDGTHSAVLFIALLPLCTEVLCLTSRVHCVKKTAAF